MKLCDQPLTARLPCSQKVSLYLSGASCNGLVHLRLCQVMAAIAAHEDVEGSSSLLQSVLTSAYTALKTAGAEMMAASISSHLTLLQYVAEEVEGVVGSWAKKQAFIRSLHKGSLHSIVTIVEEILSRAITTAADQSPLKQIAASAINCFNSWLK